MREKTLSQFERGLKKNMKLLTLIPAFLAKHHVEQSHSKQVYLGNNLIKYIGDVIRTLPQLGSPMSFCLTNQESSYSGVRTMLINQIQFQHG